MNGKYINQCAGDDTRTAGHCFELLRMKRPQIKMILYTDEATDEASGR